MAKKNPEKLAIRMRNLELSDWDKKVFDRPEIRNVFKKTFPETYRQNGIGSAYDCTIPARWPIPLDQIEKKIVVWQAEPDLLVGNMSKYISEKLPNSQLYSLPKTGHLWILEHMKDILEVLTHESDKWKVNEGKYH
jgi:hypothetical protein